jgi:hypothetical protein
MEMAISVPRGAVKRSGIWYSILVLKRHGAAAGHDAPWCSLHHIVAPCCIIACLFVFVMAIWYTGATLIAPVSCGPYLPKMNDAPSQLHRTVREFK